jgi:peptidoglycan/LPS O-acetylase OafA/YrhL
MFVRQTLKNVLSKNEGLGPGFDLVRIGLAALIFYGHCFWIAGAPNGTATIIVGGMPNGGHIPHVFTGQTYLRNMLVPMFFAVSGFLVTGSAFRTNSLRTFLIFRIFRIVPALFTEVFLSALFLGPLLTTFSLRDYLSDPRFFEYFGNIIGRVRFILPGVFLNNPQSAVNVNLWTLPAEFYCYLIVAALLAAGLLSRRKVFSLIFLIVTLYLVGQNFLEVFEIEEGNKDLLSNSLVVYYFFCGCLLFHWREWIPCNFGLFATCTVVSFFLYANGLIYVAPLFVTYMVIYMGMVKFPRVFFVQSGDYSYGVYLYGFPIAQAIICVAPQLRGHGLWLLAVATPTVFAFAVLSWHFVEKPTLRLKRVFAKAADPANREAAPVL